MVEASECRMRLQEYRDIGGGILGDLPEHIKAANPQLLTLHIIGKPADVLGFSEIDPPTSVFAVSTAVAIETISSSADDGNAAGDHLQGISSIGINGSNKMVTVQNLATTAAWSTFQLEVELWKNIFHCYGSKWGTGDKDPAGAVDVRTIADTVIVELIAGDNEGNGAAFVVPDGHVAMLYGGTLRRITATGAWANDEGIRIRIVYIDAIDGLTGLVAADRSQNWIDLIIAGQYGEQEIQVPKGQMFESGSQIIHQHSSAVNLGEDYELYLQYLIWKK
ncbi:hypothetical protein LCGC14_1811190 [marine sediment metagenome]|uniref:Uncharacterized protein n=1 Tax=marine sediment metagenome TaxID=412755 RepID=A0A0F9JLH3_9ZZZZ